MPANEPCPECGTEFGADAPGGLCPRCLVDVGVGTDDDRAPGQIIGDYELLEELGRGGMGRVYRAHQRSLDRDVALKLIKFGMDSVQVLSRFDAERQALARMDHAHIARVMDAGTTPTGAPYFVMELVQGTPITRYCDEHNLPLRQRLDLFISVCHAIQHAHQKGIIHRDIKPSNVLVTVQDGQAVPKVIDFGVAKAIGPSLTEESFATEVGSLVGTLEYMSPEQTGLDPSDIDTRSDIYALGILLYELLTGTTPLNRKSLKKVAWDQVVRLIREQEPLKPSARLTEQLAGSPAGWGSKPATGNRKSKIPRDLDWIVMKALEKDRTRRYESSFAFAQDIHRHLNDESVLAGAPSKTYRAWKWIKRNPVTAALTVSLALTVMLGFAAVLQLLHQKQQALQLAEEHHHQAAENLGLGLEAVANYYLKVAKDHRLQQPDLFPLRKELLQAAIPFLDNFTRQDSGLPQFALRRAATYRSLAEVQATMGQNGIAITNLFKGRAICEMLAAAKPSDSAIMREWAESSALLGKLLRFTGELRQGELFHREAISLSQQLVTQFPKETGHRSFLADNQADLAIFLLATGRLSEGRLTYQLALEALRGLVAAHPQESQARRALVAAIVRGEGHLAWYEAATASRTNALAEALRLGLELGVATALPAEDRFQLAHLRTFLGEAQGQLADLVAAERSLNEALSQWEALVAELQFEPKYWLGFAAAAERLGTVLTATGRWTEAERAFERSISALTPTSTAGVVHGDAPDQLARTYASMARARAAQGHMDEACQLMNQARQQQESLVNKNPARARYRSPLARILAELGELLARNGQLSEARLVFEQAATHYRTLATNAPGEPYWSQKLQEIGSHIDRLGVPSPAATAPK